MGLQKSWSALLLTLLLICSGRAQIPFDCSGQYYVTLSFLVNSPSDLYEVRFVDNGTVIFDNIKEDIGGNINAIGYRSTDNFIYGIDPDEHFLYQLDATGTAYFLGIPSVASDVGYFAGDITPDGKYLILIGGIGTDEVLTKIDLEDPDFATVNIPLDNYNTRVYDIAFDPIEGTLYGFDSNNRRLVTINPVNGFMNTAYPVQTNVNSIGALFFDTFGNLFAYGGFAGNSGEQNVLFKVNKLTGELSFAADGPLASGNDGCSCPYTVKLEKTVFPETTFPCTEAEYTFRIANYSGLEHSGIRLTDVLPEGFTVNEVLRNPYGGTVEGDPGNLVIENMTIANGLDSIIVRVNIGDLPPGLYYNQASLHNLPSQLGGFTLSDNPSTFIPEDSTVIELVPLSLEFLEEQQHFCEGDTLFIDASLAGADIFWDDGSTSAVYPVTAPGTYIVEAVTGCNSIIKTITVTSSYVRLSTDEPLVRLNLGESVFFDIDVDQTGHYMTFQWMDPNVNTLDCYDCEDVLAYPLFDAIYNVTGTNDEGCQDEVEIRVEIVKPRWLFGPNIFTPDGNGLNDVFYLSGNSSTRIIRFSVYDRWGNIVFNGPEGNLNDPGYGWDGRFNGSPVQPGVFTWIAEVEFLDGFRKVETGDITVLR